MYSLFVGFHYYGKNLERILQTPNSKKNYRHWWDLNLKPTGHKAVALPNELPSLHE